MIGNPAVTVESVPVRKIRLDLSGPGYGCSSERTNSS